MHVLVCYDSVIFLQVLQMKHKDNRIKLMNEVLNGIKVRTNALFIISDGYR